MKLITVEDVKRLLQDIEGFSADGYEWKKLTEED